MIRQHPLPRLGLHFLDSLGGGAFPSTSSLSAARSTAKLAPEPSKLSSSDKKNFCCPRKSINCRSSLRLLAVSSRRHFHLAISRTISGPSAATSRRHQQPHQQMLFTKSILNSPASTQKRLLSVTNGVASNSLSQPMSQQDTQKQIMDSEENKLLESKGNKQIKIRACGKLYQRLRKTRPVLYGGAPRTGIEFTVQYYDNLELLKGGGAQLATVCLLHGAPGHYKEFSSLISFLTHRGVRVLAPNFPDYDATYEHSFRHSPAERLDFLLEFFKVLRVDKLDLLVGHSSAVYTMFELLNHSLDPAASRAGVTTSRDFKVQVGSLGLFSTPSHKLPNNLAVTPFRLQGIRNRVDVNKIERLLIAASAVGYSQHQHMASRLELLRRHRIPVLLVYGTQDRLIPAKVFEQLARDLGPREQTLVKRYNSDGQLEEDSPRVESDGRNPGQEPRVQVSRFTSGGHYTFQRYSKQVNEDVFDFLLDRVVKSSQQSETTKL